MEKYKNEIAVKFHITDNILKEFGFNSESYIDFEYDENSNYTAYFHSVKKVIMFNLAKMSGDPTWTIIHELTHEICDRYNLCEKKGEGAHNLEFAIINYALIYRIIYKNEDYTYDKPPCFFRSYDIDEDELIDKLSINVRRFNRMITTITYRNIDELVDFTVTKTSEIRSKFRN
jgi:hypothetical protein